MSRRDRPNRFNRALPRDEIRQSGGKLFPPTYSGLEEILRMATLLTPYDWLVFMGLAVNGLAFLLIFARNVRSEQS